MIQVSEIVNNASWVDEKRLTMLENVLSHFSHGLTYGLIVVKQMSVLARVPVGEGW